MGSVLQKDRRDVWALSGQALWGYLSSLGLSIQELKLTAVDNLADDLGDGIKATRLIEDLHTIPGICEHAGYRHILNEIPDHLGMETGSILQSSPRANFFPFPYDWRRDNRVSAKELKKFIDKQLPIYREASGARKAQVILIGHSMGGLVARYYVEMLGGWESCRALITIGTPHRGAIGALDAISNGFKKRIDDFSDLVRSFSSTYQLLPIGQVVDVDGAFVRVAESPKPLPNVDQERAKEARDEFHVAMKEAHDKRKDQANYRQLLIPWAGTRQDTHQSARHMGNKVLPCYDPPLGLHADLADGDGTVPRVSATPPGLENKQLERFAVERHGWLTNDKITLDPLLSTLQQLGADEITSAMQGGSATAEPSIALGLRLESCVAEGATTVGVRVHGANDPFEVKLQITHRESRAQLDDRLITVQPGELALAEFDGLETGLYAVEVGAARRKYRGPTNVHGVFEVV